MFCTAYTFLVLLLWRIIIGRRHTPFVSFFWYVFFSLHFSRKILFNHFVPQDIATES